MLQAELKNVDRLQALLSTAVAAYVCGWLQKSVMGSERSWSICCRLCSGLCMTLGGSGDERVKSLTTILNRYPHT